MRKHLMQYNAVWPNGGAAGEATGAAECAKGGAWLCIQTMGLFRSNVYGFLLDGETALGIFIYSKVRYGSCLLCDLN